MSSMGYVVRDPTGDASPPLPPGCRPRYFKNPTAFRGWLDKYHATRSELWVGYHKKSSDKPSQTWSESVDQALCFGWIDGVRYRVDDDRYTIRFTPRRPGSIWSAVNIRKVAALEKKALMTPRGLAAFDKKSVERSKVYASERARATLDPRYEQQIRRDKRAWEFWSALAPYNKKATTHWVMSAKQEATRQRRLGSVIDAAAAGRVIPGLRRATPGPRGDAKARS